MRNHITPPKIKYILQYTENGVLQNIDVTDDFSEWKNFATDIVRDDLTGAYIQVQDSGISFTGESYDIVRSIYETQGFSAEAKLIVNVRRDEFPNLWQYEQKVSLDLNFAKYNRTKTTITVDANENGLKAIIKSKGSQKYDIPVSKLNPQTLVYDGLEIKETFTWFPSPVVGNPIIASLTGSVGEEIAVSFAPGLQSESQDVNSNYENGLIQEDQILSKPRGYGYIDNWLQWDSIEWKGQYAPKLITPPSNAQNFEILINATVNIELNLPVSSIDVYLFQNLITNQYFDNTYIGRIETGSTQNIKATINKKATITAIENTGNYYLVIIFNRILASPSENIILKKFEFETGGIVQASWNSKPKKNVNLNIVDEQSLCQELLNEMTDSKDKYTAIIEPHDESFRLASGESIRNFPTQYFHTSMSDFINYMRSCWGYEYGINGNVIYFAHRDSFFKNINCLDIQEVNNFKLSVNESYIYTGVKIGISKIEYGSINGTDEFRFVEEWSTGVKNVINVLDLTCPYRTDSYGFQLLSEKQYDNTSTDDQSDNSVFVLHVALNGDTYKLDRTAIINGVASPATMFNAIFSPRQCLIRNKSLLGVSSNTLKFTSASGNADITINGVSEKEPITIDKSLFMADVLDCDIGDVIGLPVNNDGLVSCTLEGKIYNGFIKKLTHFWGQNQKTSCQFFIYSIERDNSRDIDYDSNDYDSNDYKTR